MKSVNIKLQTFVLLFRNVKHTNICIYMKKILNFNAPGSLLVLMNMFWQHYWKIEKEDLASLYS